MGGKVNDRVNKGRGPYTFCIHGQNCHQYGGLLPTDGQKPRFGQLYICDTVNETNNRKESISGKNKTKPSSSRYSLDEDLIRQIMEVLNEHNPLVKTFRMTHDRFLETPNLQMKIKLIEDGYRIDILYRDVDDSTRVKKRVTMREFFAYKLQESVVPTLVHLGRKLYQQFVVDAYTMIEAERISYIRKNQNILRADTFTNLLNSTVSGTSENSMMGNRIKLPSSFTGSARYMIENYRDAMALSRVFGYPDLFLTFTCNPKWPEITRELDGTDFKPEDKPSFYARMFKMKLDQLMKDIRGKNYLVLLKQTENGQKGFQNLSQMQQKLRKTVIQFTEEGMVEERYQAHLNVEWCNQVASISYLLKYINKGNDMITAQLCNAETDEIQQYYDCRYVSSCEAVWRIIKFDIHHHYPSVIRLPFHLEGQQQIIFDEEELIDEVLEKPSVSTSMFIEWMNYNASNQEARELTYIEIPTKILLNKVKGPTSYEDIRTVNGQTQIEIELLKDLTLQEIHKLLQRNSSSLRSFSSMSCPSNHTRNISKNHLIIDDLSYDKSSLENEHLDFITNLTSEQKEAYDQIIKAVDHGKGAALRRKGEIVLNVASSGIAALLLSGGQTAHSRFNIPIHPTDESFCSISPSSKLGELIRRTKLFIWDEAPMVNKMCAKAVNRSMHDICRQSNPDSMDTLFGGKTVMFGGDFRQILPVIQKGKREDIVDASLNSSYLWDYVTVLKLTVNMKLCGNGDVDESEDGVFDIEIPQDLLITDLDDPIGSIISTIYPDYLFNLGNLEYYQQRAILALTQERSYLDGEESIEVGGLPKNNLRLKIGVPVMLLQNIDQAGGLCNGTRLQIVHLGEKIIKAKILTGSNVGKITALSPSVAAIQRKKKNVAVGCCFRRPETGERKKWRERLVHGCDGGVVKVEVPDGNRWSGGVGSVGSKL
ncbi:uncharacterized protein [Rutidosis leptorrhynchoides]|uniref:uncharacterized protein n=1 Tax=Rutidosis leptorrhynchoides TaxID=125765 RepID=UPI003A99B05F